MFSYEEDKYVTRIGHDNQEPTKVDGFQVGNFVCLIFILVILITKYLLMNFKAIDAIC